MKYKSFNVFSLQEEFKNDEEILSEMITSFFEVFDDLLQPIRESIEAKDSAQLRFNAHTFKGVMSNFYAEKGRLLAHELEVRGENDSFDDAIDILNKLETQLVFFLYEMQLFKKDITLEDFNKA